MNLIDTQIKSIQQMGTIDKSLNKDRLSLNFIKTLSEIPKLRKGYDSGGIVDPLDQEILELETIVGLRPVNGYEAQIIEQMKDRLLHLYSLKKGRQ